MKSRETTIEKAQRMVVMTDGGRVVAIGDHAIYTITNGRCSCTAGRYRSTCAHVIASREYPVLSVEASLIAYLLVDTYNRRRALNALAKLLTPEQVETLIADASTMAKDNEVQHANVA